MLVIAYYIGVFDVQVYYENHFDLVDSNDSGSNLSLLFTYLAESHPDHSEDGVRVWALEHALFLLLSSLVETHCGSTGSLIFY